MVHDPGRHRRRSLTRAELASAWLSDRMPLSLRGRVALGGRELGLIALVGAVGLCAVAVLALRSSAAAAAPVSVAASTAATPLASSAKKGLGKVVMVDVSGAVAHPRVVTLPAGSRVFEALKAAGGAKRGVDVTSLNLARVVVDGEQIIVGRAPPSRGGESK